MINVFYVVIVVKKCIIPLW